MLKSCENKGFQLSFANGYTISVQYGPGNYCNRRSMDWNSPMRGDSWEAESAEIAAWQTESETWVKLSEYDDVIGYLSADEVANAIQIISTLPPVSSGMITQQLNITEVN